MKIYFLLFNFIPTISWFFYIPMTNQSNQPFDSSKLNFSFTPAKYSRKLLIIKHGSNQERYDLLFENVRINHLSKNEKIMIQELLWKYNDIILLPGDNLQETLVKIVADTVTKPCHPTTAKIYHFPPIHKAEVNKQMTEYRKHGIIRHSSSPCNIILRVTRLFFLLVAKKETDTLKSSMNSNF